MKEQIIAIWDKLGSLVGYDEHGWPITITKEDCADEIEKLYQCEHILEKVKEYLNECIAKAEPNLSKIKDVDNELAEIRGIKQTCSNCKYAQFSVTQYPCSECNWGEHDLKWKPKTKEDENK